MTTFFDLDATSLNPGDRLSRTVWDGTKWVVWPIDRTRPSDLIRTPLVLGGTEVRWEEAFADMAQDDWVVLP